MIATHLVREGATMRTEAVTLRLTQAASFTVLTEHDPLASRDLPPNG